ncbi:hypothetical protein ACPT9H_18455 [Brevibacillus borstelensis]|uniref:hypothetical protein n=1 Tax=Brevibacillus borstelensis TaxID=45462 RepID=UPI003CE45126
MRGRFYDVDGAIAYLYDMGLSKGKGDKPTIVGFDAKAALTRAEAVQFLKTIVDKVADLSMRQRAQAQQTNPNVSKYKDQIPQPQKPPAQQPSGFKVPSADQIKMVFDIDGYRVYIENPASGFMVYKNNSPVLTVTIQGALTMFAADMRSLHKNPELPMLVQQVVALYGLPPDTVAYDINKGKDNALTKKYGNYSVSIATQGIVTSLIIRK